MDFYLNKLKAKWCPCHFKGDSAMCKKASHTYFFSITWTINHLAFKKIMKFAKKKKAFYTNLYSLKHGKKQSCRQLHLHSSSELGLSRKLTSFFLSSFPACRYWDKMSLQRHFYYHHFLPRTLHLHTLFSQAGLWFLLFCLFLLPCPLKLRQQHFVVYCHGSSMVIC